LSPLVSANSSLGHGIVCPSIYGFLLRFWYYQTFTRNSFEICTKNLDLQQCLDEYLRGWHSIEKTSPLQIGV
jgi:hypothetical protein